MFGNRGNGLKPFKRIYRNSDWGLTADVVCQPTQWTRVGQVTVPAQQQVTFGFNDPVGGASVAGAPCYVRLDAATGGGTQLHGKIRFALTNANETNTVIVLEESTARLSSDVSDRTKAVLLPEFTSLKAGEDSKLQILFYPDSATAVTVDYDGTNTSLSVPVTVYQ